MQKNVLEYLEATAARLPDKVAFADEGQSFTFAQLLGLAQRCGSAIARKAGGVNRPVAVLTDRTAGSVLAFLGVLYSGNYYVPVDRAMPLQRMRLLMEDLEPAAFLFPEGALEVETEFAGLCPCLPMAPLLEMPADAALLARQRGRVLDVDPAYAIFTSGSTGTPKGIVVSHHSVIDFVDWYVKDVGITQEDVLGNQAPFFFDLSVKDLYSVLAAGASAYILPKKCFSFPVLLIKELDEHKITTLSWATSAFHIVANSGVLEKHPPAHVRRVIVGGEALQARQLNIWRRAVPRAEFINLYGPTEVTVDCTCYHIDREFADGEPVPIGRACANMEVLLLDGRGRLVEEAGTTGEICVRGAGLAKGYYRDPDRTAGAFIQNPLNPHCPDRLYRTGDLGYWGRDGLLYFSTRQDGQIKHGGYRIELGEVETALNSQPSVEAGICFFDAGKDRLVCIYQGEVQDQALAAALRGILPKYMVPNIYIRVQAMPYNANGKIDRVKLKEEYDKNH